MKKKIFSLLSIMLCFCFILGGCNLFTEDLNAKNNLIVFQSDNVVITREEFLNGYKNYYSTFYQQNNNDAEKALNSLMEYLVSKKIYLNDAEKLIEENKIVLTNTEKNYLWYLTYNSFVTNIESFEEEFKDSININQDEENSSDKEEKEQESNFIYTPFDKQAEIIFNDLTNQYEISIIKEILTYKFENNEEIFEYKKSNEAKDYDDSNLDLYNINYVFEKLNKEKYYSDKEILTDEEKQNKIITKEAVRRYIEQLKINEQGKNLTTESQDILEREINRIYNIYYENLLINKLYEYKTQGIEVDEEDLLKFYLSKVKACYDRYYQDPDVFIEELTTTVGSANLYGNYSTSTNSIADVFYIPKGDLDESFFYVTHIVIKLTDVQIQKINDLKADCELNGKDEEYFNQELNKIVPNIGTEIINKIIDLKYKLEENTITEEEYQNQVLEVIENNLLMVDERDEEGYITEDVMTVQEMIANLYKDLDQIYIKYYGEAGNSITLNGHEYNPTENGLIIAEQKGNNDEFVLSQLEVDYNNERADKFNEYIYKYSQDTGTIQIQTSYFGTTSENWYLYAMGTGETDNGFVKEFVEAARELNSENSITSVKTILMQNWSTKDGVETLQSGSTGFSTLMFAGKVNNLFECFDNNKFELEDLLAEEPINKKYYSLLKMDQYRLGLTMNKTLFDLIFEEYYESIYTEKITMYEDEIMKNIEISINYDVINDILE